MALAHDRIAPCHQPKRLALAMVMRKAGSGAMTDWNTISKNDTTAAAGPYCAMNSLAAEKSPVANMAKTEPTHSCTAGTKK